MSAKKSIVKIRYQIEKHACAWACKFYGWGGFGWGGVGRGGVGQGGHHYTEYMYMLSRALFVVSMAKCIFICVTNRSTT